jgi:23S rRNA (uracil1939-C5)-methyltransferase
VLDLYCGTGTLGLAVSPSCERVVGVELVPEAVESARKNAARNELAATFHAGDVGAVVADPAFRAALGPVDVVLLDPPRTGLLPGALAALGALEPPRLIYVSCKPESLARDLRALEAIGYRPEGPAQPVDLFPQSHHVETVVSLTRVGSA